MTHTILIADDSQLSREYLTNILKPAGYNVIQAIDGGSAMKVVTEHNVSLAIIDHYMAPYGGLEFAHILHGRKIDLPMIMVTNEETSDLLLEVTRAGIGSFFRKPADPARLLETIRRALRQTGVQEPVAPSSSIATETIKTHFMPNELMDRAIELARRNVENKIGGPYGAVVADAEGRILGEGANGIMYKSDPIAHAEVMAIRAATEKLNNPSLEGCILYSSSEPTRIGKALIDSVGLTKVYYGVSHDEMSQHYPLKAYSEVHYEQMSHDAARAIICDKK